MSYDTIVIGAGLAGLACARRLSEAGQTVLVLEARDRVGGRTETVSAADGTPVDVGGQWIGPTQHRVNALIEELRLATFPQHTAGRHQITAGGRTKAFRGKIPRLSVMGLADLQRNIWRIDFLARRLSRDAPQEYARAAAWDRVRLSEWLTRATCNAQARSLLETAVRAVYAKDPRDLSLLQFLYYVRTAGGLMRLIETDGGAQETRIDGGAQQLSEGLASRLRERGTEIRLQTPARAVLWNGRGVTVRTDGDTVSARRLVIAMAPSACGRIDFEPSLPKARRRLCDAMPMGRVIKCVAVYERSFWRDGGWSGQWAGDSEPCTMVFDDTPASGRHGALVGFILGSATERFSEPETRRDAVLAQLRTLFGDAAAKPSEFIDKDWTRDPWSAGCYAGLMRPGEMTDLAGALRRPVGPVHWAGTETATVWNGYMDGALQSAERAAEEIVAAERG